MRKVLSKGLAVNELGLLDVDSQITIAIAGTVLPNQKVHNHQCCSEHIQCRLECGMTVSRVNDCSDRGVVGRTL